jgi:hypothetical protein
MNIPVRLADYDKLNCCAWFQAYAAMLMKSALFWDITQRRVVVLYRHFGTTYLLGLLDP